MRDWAGRESRGFWLFRFQVRKSLSLQRQLFVFDTSEVAKQAALDTMSAAQILTPRDELVISLENHNTTFNKLLSLIPAKFYIAPTAEEVGRPSVW